MYQGRTAKRGTKRKLTGAQSAVTNRRPIRNNTFIFQLCLQEKQEYLFLRKFGLFLAYGT